MATANQQCRSSTLHSVIFLRRMPHEDLHSVVQLFCVMTSFRLRLASARRRFKAKNAVKNCCQKVESVVEKRVETRDRLILIVQRSLAFYQNLYSHIVILTKVLKGRFYSLHSTIQLSLGTRKPMHHLSIRLVQLCVKLHLRDGY